MDTPGCTIVETEAGFDYWSRRPSLSPTIQQAVREADIVLVPFEGFRDYQGVLFPVGTEELVQNLREQLDPNLKFDVAIEDTDYKELALHGDLVIIADFLVKYIVAPVAVGLIVDYLRKRLGSRFRSADVRSSLIVDQSEESVRRTMRISYEGPASTFEAVFKDALNSLSVHKRKGTEQKNLDSITDRAPKTK